MQVAAKCSHTCPYKTETKGGLTPTHRGWCYHRSRDCSDTTLSQESCSHPTLEARKRCSFRNPWAWGVGRSSADTWIAVQSYYFGPLASGAVRGWLSIVLSAMKHHYKQSEWRWWNSSWAISNPQRWCCESAALSRPANLENSAVATGLEKVSFHSNPKERQCQRMFKLPHNFTHLVK